MDITHFAFAFYVFLLVGVLIWFYARVTRSGKKKDGSAQEKEQHLFKLYQNIEDMLGGFEEYAEEAKAAIDERLKNVEALIAVAQTVAEARPLPMGVNSQLAEAVDTKPSITRKLAAEAAVRKVSKPKPEAAKKPTSKRASEPEEIKPVHADRLEAKSAQRGTKAAAEKSRQNVDELIPQYIAQGMSREQIARELGISTRAVSLMMEVKKIGIPGGQN